jgi:zinc protease
MAFDAELERRVQALTVEQVNAAFRKYLDPSQLSAVKAGDFAAKKPGT